MKRILLFITTVIFCMNIYSSQVEFKEYRSIAFSEITKVNYQVILKTDYSVYDFQEKTFKPAISSLSNSGTYLHFNLSNNVEPVLPTKLELHANYPNPFNPETTISFDLPKDSKVRLEVYNIKGQKVKTLTNEKLNAGNHRVVWNGRNANNKQVASGIYFYRLITDKKKLTKKMILMK